MRHQVETVGELLRRSTGQLRQGCWDVLVMIVMRSMLMVMMTVTAASVHIRFQIHWPAAPGLSRILRCPVIVRLIILGVVSNHQHHDHHDDLYTNMETILGSLLGEIFAGQWSKAGTLCPPLQLPIS